MELLQKLLYFISNALLAPVLTGLLLMLAWTLVLVGGFLKETLERRQIRRAMDRAMEAAKAEGLDREVIWEELSLARRGLAGRLAAFVNGSWADEAVVQQGIAQMENRVAASVARHSFCTRVSPMLGLMGTLIPLGPALSGLANGDMQALAGNLVVAFTATVVGLLISAVTFGIGLVRRTWYARDVTELEFLCQRVFVRERNHVT